MTDTIYVWRIRPLRRVGGAAALKTILPAEEVARVERSGNAESQRSAITSRAVMRLLLAHYTHIPANELRFVAGKNGKPYLEKAQNPLGVTFNFSDSADMALLAVTYNREVGVDVEHVRKIERGMEIAARRFSAESAAELQNASAGDRNRIFLQNWARHEALLKARAGTIWSPDGVQDGAAYAVRDVDTGLDYVGALAAKGEGWSIDVKDYSD